MQFCTMLAMVIRVEHSQTESSIRGLGKQFPAASKNTTVGTGGVAPWLRAFAVLPLTDFGSQHPCQASHNHPQLQLQEI